MKVLVELDNYDIQNMCKEEIQNQLEDHIKPRIAEIIQKEALVEDVVKKIYRDVNYALSSEDYRKIVLEAFLFSLERKEKSK